MKGKLVTFEGCEGVGKSKQISLLQEYLKANNIQYYLTREPGGSVVSEKISCSWSSENSKFSLSSSFSLILCSAK